MIYAECASPRRDLALAMLGIGHCESATRPRIGHVGHWPLRFTERLQCAMRLRAAGAASPRPRPGAVRRVLQNDKHQTPQAHERSRTDCHVSAHACHHVRDIRSLFTRRTESEEETGVHALCVAGMTPPCAPDCETVRTTPPSSPWPASKTKRTFSSPALLGCSGFMRTTKGLSGDRGALKCQNGLRFFVSSSRNGSKASKPRHPGKPPPSRTAIRK